MTASSCGRVMVASSSEVLAAVNAEARHLWWCPSSMADEPAALLGKEVTATFFPEKTKEKGGEGRHPHRFNFLRRVWWRPSCSRGETTSSDNV